MKRKLLFLALTLAACFTLLPSTALALDYDVFTYDDGDVAVIQTLVENGVLDSAGYPLDGDPWRWEGVGWSGDYDTTQRITSLSLSELTGTLDVSGLDALKTLYCSGNESLTGLIVSGCTSLKTLECSNTGITVLDVS
ncbi:MAG: hypothetical protein IJA73_03735, partial [Oscillospiraceae bacterium]|nr:hypothetical protein [Oscillospiraceae bacterium]